VGVIGSLGVRQDAASVALLAALLPDADAAVARAAWGSLKHVTGLKLAPNRALWIAALDS